MMSKPSSLFYRTIINYCDNLYVKKHRYMIAKIQDNKVCYMSWPTTRTWQWRSKLYDKRDDLNFPIMNCSYLCSSFPSAARASGIYISQLIWYFRVRGYFKDALDRRFPTYMEATGPTVTSGQVKASLLKKVWRLCSPLRNIHVKDDQEYLRLT